MNLKLELIEINNDVIVTSGAGSVLCGYTGSYAKFKYNGSNESYYNFLYSNVPGPYEVLKSGNSFEFYNCDGSKTDSSVLEIGKFYHVDFDYENSTYRFYLCEDENHVWHAQSGK